MDTVTNLFAAFAVVIASLIAVSPAAATGCQNHPWAEQPCPGVAEKWDRFLALQELHASLAAARSFEAFLAGRDEEALHFLAIARGEGAARSLTTGQQASPEVARVQRRRETGCIADPYASTPCLGTSGAWQSYASERGLEESWQSSRDFVARLSDRPTAAAQLGGQGVGLEDAANEDGATPATDTVGRLIIRVYPGAPFEGS